MNIKIKILGVQIIKTHSEKVKARADVHFEGFWLKGFKVLRDEDKKKEYVTPPSYLSPSGWRTLFKTDLPEDWQEIQCRILEEYDHHLIEESVSELDKEN